MQNDNVIMNQPSKKAQRIMVEFFMKTSIPRILAALDRGELVWENGQLVRAKEVTAHANPQRLVR
ncbi:hypothetical protein SAMN05192569_10012 [Parageobacillus thermantarcticus]|uniref:Uncharacterized protein n=1 Tax=Parageobacillus thermantarcticus TaxID=186116 RepID=A0A1I0SGW2_9BACL|nr:hypothetical protein [Parageobacillus thermantarcticus]SFA37996.1 hypothetical protein SAMN05192569_10012 [Parageobacillus thermantarcticus]